MNYGYNYSTPQYMQNTQPYNPNMQYNNQTFTSPRTGLQGQLVDSVDVVKAMSIPLDGSRSYFPLADGSAIVTKQLNSDGTSKTVVYKPSNQIDKVVGADDDIKLDLEELRYDIDNIKKELDKIKGKED